MLLIPLRLGLTDINEAYVETLKVGTLARGFRCHPLWPPCGVRATPPPWAPRPPRPELSPLGLGPGRELGRPPTLRRVPVWAGGVSRPAAPAALSRVSAQARLRAPQRCFTMPQSLGVIGGKPNSAHYFIGYVGEWGSPGAVGAAPHAAHPTGRCLRPRGPHPGRPSRWLLLGGPDTDAPAQGRSSSTWTLTRRSRRWSGPRAAPSPTRASTASTRPAG